MNEVQEGHAVHVNEGGNVAKETMTGDLRDIIMDILRTQAKSWGELQEDEQATLAADIQERCEHIVQKAVGTIAADGRQVLVGVLKQVTVKDGLKAVIEFSKTDELRHELIDSTGTSVLIIVGDNDQYSGERAPAKIDPNQHELIEHDDDGPVADNGRATQ